MTSKDIEGTPAVNLSHTAWLRELCWQVARMNERSAAEQKHIAVASPPPVIVPEKRGPGRPRMIR